MGAKNALTFGLLERYRNWKYGGVTGLNYVQANVRMTTYVALPWFIGYMVCFILVPDPFLEPSILLMSALWVCWCYFLYARAKVDASTFRCFPQSQWRFPDGGTAKYDLTIDPNGMSKECDFKDGSQGWRIALGKRFQYWDKRSEFPFVFTYALLKFPKAPDECFQFLSEGEFFHQGVAIKLSTCENISVYIKDWFQDPQGRYVPVGAINDSSRTYGEFMESGKVDKKMLKKMEALNLKFMNERSRRMSLERHTKTLEDIVNTDVEDSKDFERRVELGMSRRRDLYKNIMDTQKPLIQRIKGKIGWILLAIGFVVVFLWIMGMI